MKTVRNKFAGDNDVYEETAINGFVQGCKVNLEVSCFLNSAF